MPAGQSGDRKTRDGLSEHNEIRVLDRIDETDGLDAYFPFENRTRTGSSPLNRDDPKLLPRRRLCFLTSSGARARWKQHRVLM